MSREKWLSKPTVSALLGPTNTGKTHHALTRMLNHRSGIIGLPLRLLAREVYDRLVNIRGRDEVALITGEEKIRPPKARYFVCTTESMPSDIPVCFVAVDEIQLAAHRQRGHVFTDRLLNARGTKETLFLGSDVIEPILRRLLPGIRIDRQPRLSSLTYTGYRKLTSLAPRTAVVGFAAERIYALAERLRQRHGGTAVVLGALSPRSRNAQVSLYENGDVDYLVATDAIGMGLNLDVRHVAMADDWKFDGWKSRALRSDELAQIVGRAGRYKQDGTFGTTDRVDGFDEGVVEALHQHRFDPLQRIFWRSSELDLRSLDSLRVSLERRPPFGFCVQKRDADDHLALERLVLRDEIRGLARGEEAVSVLWSVCGIPDFNSALPAYHSEFLAMIFSQLMANDGCLPEDYVAERVGRLDRDDGNIETLMARIGAIRTWTFIANKGDWLKRAEYWQERTQTVEDRISDALHQRLTERFVDRRASVLRRQITPGSGVRAELDSGGRAYIAGEAVAEVQGLDVCLLDKSPSAKEYERELRRCLLPVVSQQLDELLEDDDLSIRWGALGRIVWRGGTLAWVEKGKSLFEPRLRVTRSEWLDGEQRARLFRRLERWLSVQIGLLSGLFSTDGLHSSGERAIMYALLEGVGVVSRDVLGDNIRSLNQGGRKRLKRRGICFGQRYVWMPAVFEDNSLKLALWLSNQGVVVEETIGVEPVVLWSSFPEELLAYLGFERVGDFGVRADHLERYWSNPGCHHELFGDQGEAVLAALKRRRGGKKRGRKSPKHRPVRGQKGL